MDDIFTDIKIVSMQPNACAIKKIRDEMAPKQTREDQDEQSVQRRSNLPDEIVHIIWPALQVGGAAGG